MSVGNLPPHASVLIKITYVAELQVEAANILFTIPGSVAPWKQEAALGEVTQHDVDTVKVNSQDQEVTLHIAVEMPFDIKSVFKLINLMGVFFVFLRRNTLF